MCLVRMIWATHSSTQIKCRDKTRKIRWPKICGRRRARPWAWWRVSNLKTQLIHLTAVEEASNRTWPPILSMWTWICTKTLWSRGCRLPIRGRSIPTPSSTTCMPSWHKKVANANVCRRILTIRRRIRWSRIRPATCKAIWTYSLATKPILRCLRRRCLSLRAVEVIITKSSPISTRYLWDQSVVAPTRSAAPKNTGQQKWPLKSTKDWPNKDKRRSFAAVIARESDPKSKDKSYWNASASK